MPVIAHHQEIDRSADSTRTEPILESSEQSVLPRESVAIRRRAQAVDMRRRIWIAKP